MTVRLTALSALALAVAAHVTWGQADYTRDRPDPTSELHAVPPVTTPPGTLTYAWGVSWAFGHEVTVSGPGRFRRATPGRGTVNPDAQVARVAVGEQQVAVALDSREARSAHFNILRLDLTGAGDFRQGPTVDRTLMSLDRSARSFTYEFNEVPLRLTIEGRELPVFLRATYTDAEGPRGTRVNQSLKLRFQVFAQGACRFGDAVHNVRVVDGTGNLRLTDTAGPPGGQKGSVDKIVIDIGKGDFEETLAVPYGRPVLVDGRLFEVAVSEADMQVSASPYGGPVGFVRMGKPFWKAALGLGDAAFDICGGPDPVPLPPGTYEILHFREWPTPDITQPGNYLTIGRQWTDHSGFASKPVPPFTVVAGKTADVPAGSPIRAGLTVRKESGAVVFRLQAYDAGGRFMPRIEHNRNIHWYQKNPNSVDVKGAGGRVVARCEMDWKEHQCEARWPIPPGARGAYSAVLSFAAGPFEARTSPVSFTVP